MQASSHDSQNIVLIIKLMIFKKFTGQDWIGLNFSDQDWTWTEKLHSALTSCLNFSRLHHLIFHAIGFEHDPVLDREPTGFCSSELDPVGLDFETNFAGSDLDIQTALITAVKWTGKSKFFRI